MNLLQLKRRDAAPAGAALDRVWALALARAARDESGLALALREVQVSVLSLAEVLELPPEQALIAVLDEAGGPGLGLMLLCSETVAGVVEQLTTGQVLVGRAAPRRPTRTDVALVAPLIDAALAALEGGMSDEGGWALGYRYASTVADARSLGLLLEDVSYRVLRGRVDLAEGTRSGEVILALPDQRRVVVAAPAAPEERDFGADLAAQVAVTAVQMDAVLLRLTLPLGMVLALQPGQVIDLATADLGRIALEGGDGRPVAQGRLGRQGGMRAVRLTEGVVVPVAAVPDLPGVTAAG
jgi:flagellar motor switch protein FliM